MCEREGERENIIIEYTYIFMGIGVFWGGFLGRGGEEGQLKTGIIYMRRARRDGRKSSL